MNAPFSTYEVPRFSRKKGSSSSGAVDLSEPGALLPDSMQKNASLLLPPGQAAQGDAAALLMDQVIIGGPNRVASIFQRKKANFGNYFPQIFPKFLDKT